MKKFLLIPFILFGFLNPLNAEEVEDKWVRQIRIPEGSRQTYLPESKDLLITVVHETWSPIEKLKTLKIGDTITGTDGKDKTRSFLVGAIQCSYHSRDYISGGRQYMWEGKWDCIAGRSKNEIKQFYERGKRRVDVFTTSPINQEDIIDLSVPDKKLSDAIKYQLAEYACLWKEGIVNSNDIKKYIEEEKKNDPEFGNVLEASHEKGYTQQEMKEQDQLIAKTGGCKNIVLTWIVMSYSEEDASEFIAVLMSEGWLSEEEKKEIKDIPLREKSYFDKSENTVYCREPLPEMRLAENANPTNKEISNLCSCIWNKNPKNSWERNVLIKMFNNKSETAIFRERNLRERLVYNYQDCGGYKL